MQSMDPEIKAYLEGIDRKIEDMERRLADYIESAETRLLSNARVTHLRLRRLDAAEATTVDRLTGLEERIFTMERRLAGGK